MTKPIVAVDIDDVLSKSAEGFATYSNKLWNAGITADDYTEKWAEAWNIPESEAMQRADVYHKTDVAHHFKPIDNALQVLHRLSPHYHFVAVTSRRSQWREVTEQWLDKHFTNVFAEMHFVGMWDADMPLVDKVKATKTVTCQQIGARYLIDDQLKHCSSAAEAGIPAVLFGAYKWNAHDVLPKGVERVHNWLQIEEYFSARRRI